MTTLRPFETAQHLRILPAALISAMAFVVPVIALAQDANPSAGTLAGTPIENTARVSYDGANGNRIERESNTATIIVDEILDVGVESTDPGDVGTQPDATQQVLTYTVTNNGNGQEAFTLTPDTARPGDDFDPDFVQIVIDTNDNGVFDPGVDEVYAAGSNDPLLAPDGNVTIFIISNIPSDPVDGNRAEVTLAAAAVTGTGTPGTTFDGAGDGGGDAVVGTTGADDDAPGFFLVQAASVSLQKSAQVADPFGGETVVPGSVITYTLVATITGSGTLPNLTVGDPIPENTTYRPETLTLEGAALTDTDADADGGAFDGTAIAVQLGDLTGDQTRTITFQVEVN
ncbi:hypothetical protein [Alterisphingorhabdus coralli]|uniref:DUF11 domain-containing protein n=1 Tax=Alterisphingorhabdus coralli TaxID=3071408 RepID=A0AA97F422_9SPHN|nr:hypothetical protein [Parasphingorhabdus sp. SCSIO 66989]WOE73901.1 hypothetical protein RB602_08475 [Parasphingorhabdus sp. SCSIO 66989]